jgi:putative transposase
MAKVVRRAYKYRFYPTAQQAELLNRTFGCVRYVYNRALAERSRAWTQEQRRVTFPGTCRMLTTWKAEPETAWLHEVSNVALQQGLQHLQNAFVSFWGSGRSTRGSSPGNGRSRQLRSRRRGSATGTVGSSWRR